MCVVARGAGAAYYKCFPTRWYVYAPAGFEATTQGLGITSVTEAMADVDKRREGNRLVEACLTHCRTLVLTRACAWRGELLRLPVA